MTGQPGERVPAPSEVVGPEALDQALLVLVVRRGGTSFLSVANDVDDDELGAWVHSVADRLAAGEHRGACPDCAAGIPHDHDPRG